MQTKYVRDNDKFEIKIDFPQKKFEEYLKLSGANTTSDLTDNQMVQLLSLAFNDYNSGAISLDGLSVIANELFNIVTSNPNMDKELFSILENVGDAAYQLRQGDITKDLSDYLKNHTGV